MSSQILKFFDSNFGENDSNEDDREDDSNLGEKLKSSFLSCTLTGSSANFQKLKAIDKKQECADVSLLICLHSFRSFSLAVVTSRKSCYVTLNQYLIPIEVVQRCTK